MTNLEQQDIEAFKSWANGTNPAVNPSYYQTWQAALAYERGKSGWQSMDTAPKDFTCVLLVWHPPMAYKGPVVVAARWNCRKHSYSSRRHDCPNEPECDMGWDRYAGEFTAWQPLPSPPATQPQEMER